MCEHACQVRKPLDLDRVARGVAKEHRPLFARFALKPDRGFQHEIGACRCQPVGKGLPVGQSQHQPEMGHGHHRLANLSCCGIGKGRAQMQAELMAEKVEINPGVGRTPLGAAQRLPVKGAGGVKIMNMDGKVIYQSADNEVDIILFMVLSHTLNTNFLPSFIIVEQLP